MPEPLYRAIADHLRAQIESGALGPGDQLPTELELRQQFDDVSRNTVRDAIKSLAILGLVVSKPGKGTFVAQRIVPLEVTLSDDPKTGLGGGEGTVYTTEAAAQQRERTATSPRVEHQRASGEVARALRMEPGAQLVSRHQQLLIDGQPWALQTSFYPWEFVTHGASRLQVAEDIPEGTVAYLKTIGIVQVGYQDTLIARQPNEGELAYFRLTQGSGAVMIVQTRTGFDDSGRPIRCTITVWSADRNWLVYYLGKVPRTVTHPTDDASPPLEGG